MDLRQRLKQARTRPKEPFRRTAFTVVSSLVREHHLNERFLNSLREVAAQEAGWLHSYEPQPKEPCKAPLFGLVPSDEFGLIQAILATADNPYVPFAHSPEELLLSGWLFRLNPDLAPGVLAQVHFRALLARELVQAELRDLEARPKASAGFQVEQAVLLRRLQRLSEFVDSATEPDR
jgi:hypothetical protein